MTVPLDSVLKSTLIAVSTEIMMSVITSFCPLVGAEVTLATAPDWSAEVKAAPAIPLEEVHAAPASEHLSLPVKSVER